MYRILYLKFNKLDPYIVLLVCFIIYGFILRIYDLGSQSIWYDEGYSINAALNMLEKGLPVLPSGHLYSRDILNTSFIAISLGFFGTSEFAARLPAVFFGVVTIPLVFIFTKRVADRKVALIAAFLTTFSVLEIAWSREARMYQQLQFFFILSIFLFYEITQKIDKRHLILASLSTLCAILSHSFGFSLIIIYAVYLITINARDFRKYLSKEFLTNWKTIAVILTVVAVLIFGEVSFGIFSTLWGWKMNYLPDYWQYLRETIPAILFISMIGAVLFLIKRFKPALLLLLAVIVPFYFIAFHIKLLGFRYVYFFLPVLFIFYSYAATHLLTFLPAFKLKKVLNLVLAIIIIGFTLYFSGFNFVPQSVYYLEETAPQPDFKQAYGFVNDNMSSNDIIIDTWPAVGNFYLEKPPDYWLVFDITGLNGESLCVGEDNKREIYTNTLCIMDLATLESLISGSNSGWLVLDGLARYRLPLETNHFINEKLTFCPEGSSSNISGEVMVYRWGYPQQ